jgi:collagenase-like PrtC family protease
MRVEAMKKVELTLLDPVNPLGDGTECPIEDMIHRHMPIALDGRILRSSIRKRRQGSNTSRKDQYPNQDRQCLL